MPTRRWMNGLRTDHVTAINQIEQVPCTYSLSGLACNWLSRLAWASRC